MFAFFPCCFFSCFFFLVLVNASEESRSLFTEFKSTFKKKYASIEEDNLRFRIFTDNMAHITAHNANPKKKYTLGMNSFSDLTDKEFESSFLDQTVVPKMHLIHVDEGIREGNRFVNMFREENSVREINSLEANSTAGLPHLFGMRKRARVILDDSAIGEVLDWRSFGVVSPVSNQGECGSCYAITAVGAIESLFAIRQKNIKKFSVQQIIDCSASEGNRGCKEGRTDFTFNYVKKNGICSEESYPLRNREEQCQALRCSSVTALSGYSKIEPLDDYKLFEAVQMQPVAALLSAASNVFKSYKSGIIDDASCGIKLNHYVLIVGYDLRPENFYWIVRNSWGTNWGEGGYFRVAAGVPSANQCGISLEAYVPEMK